MISGLVAVNSAQFMLQLG